MDVISSEQLITLTCSLPECIALSVLTQSSGESLSVRRRPFDTQMQTNQFLALNGTYSFFLPGVNILEFTAICPSSL